MGSQESKAAEQTSEQEEKQPEIIQNDSTPSTPILTPLDPRSPSANIARTPLEVRHFCIMGFCYCYIFFS